MEQGTWIEVLVTWLPILLLAAVWLIMMERGRSAYTGKNGKSHGEMLEEHIAELRRQNDLLEKVVKDQDMRIARLETRRSGGGGGTGGGAGSSNAASR